MCRPHEPAAVRRPMEADEVSPAGPPRPPVASQERHQPVTRARQGGNGDRIGETSGPGGGGDEERRHGQQAALQPAGMVPWPAQATEMSQPRTAISMAPVMATRLVVSSRSPTATGGPRYRPRRRRRGASRRPRSGPDEVRRGRRPWPCRG